MDPVRVRFVHHAGPYNPDEVAGFAPDTAARLVKLGVALPEDPPAASAEDQAALAAEAIRVGDAVIPAGAGPESDAQRIALGHQLIEAKPAPGTKGATIGPSFTNPEREPFRPGRAGSLQAQAAEQVKAEKVMAEKPAAPKRTP